MKVLQNIEPLLLAFVSLGIYLWAVLIFFRYFGKAGLYTYMAIAIIGANTMVLKVSFFAVFQQPIALGTALFSSTYLASDLLSEYYGRKAALTGIFISFAAMLFWSVITFLMLSYRPLGVHQAGAEFDWALATHGNMQELFSLTPAIFVASLLAYLSSQLNDVYVYAFIKKITKNKFLFIRNNVSTAISTLIDNTVFSFTAFILLNPNPIDWSVLLVSYILLTYGLRLIFAILDTPFIYLARFFLPSELRKPPLAPTAA